MSSSSNDEDDEVAVVGHHHHQSLSSPFPAGKHQHQKHLRCANCGQHGHVYKKCLLPIISYGVICVQHLYNERMFLMVRRKDSLSYVEFLRGKYSLNNKAYILKLVSLMTFAEQSRIVQNTFSTLWRMLWQIKDCTSFKREYDHACAKFETLKRGVDVDHEHVSLCSIVLEATCKGCGFPETEWGFAKGRRNIGESDVGCALREFYEETGLLKSVPLRVDENDVYDETFVGSNSMTYKHVYYLAQFRSPDVAPAPTHTLCQPDRFHNREVAAVGWFTAQDVLDRIRYYNPERRQLFLKVLEKLASSNPFEARAFYSSSSSATASGDEEAPQDHERHRDDPDVGQSGHDQQQVDEPAVDDAAAAAAASG